MVLFLILLIMNKLIWIYCLWTYYTASNFWKNNRRNIAHIIFSYFSNKKNRYKIFIRLATKKYHINLFKFQKNIKNAIFFTLLTLTSFQLKVVKIHCIMHFCILPHSASFRSLISFIRWLFWCMRFFNFAFYWYL